MLSDSEDLFTFFKIKLQFMLGIVYEAFSTVAWSVAVIPELNGVATHCFICCAQCIKIGLKAKKVLQINSTHLNENNHS